MTSGKVGTSAWRLIFERRRTATIDPLMGWTGCDDPMAPGGAQISDTRGRGRLLRTAGAKLRGPVAARLQNRSPGATQC
ncbi:ETC complex I subunit [Sinorhizobium numidicum]|uniref:ETC complex I subunit n=2 Tax=Sinorhizobium numidicum TaxID=680248 RepID=A0ABY8CPC2_9HYPH|nr:NADH dehydrogenase ubiquinone Fe-S protein 4 [Sinorhizobium numidicum]WEX74516.1 ETC complex I subunit [Sinorhizobium numidicum]WEX80506.1 ETC complex I subunit [Sinorhizobium numidicum]